MMWSRHNRFKAIISGQLSAEKWNFVLAFLCTSDKEARLELETSKGRKLVLSPSKYGISARGGRGREMARRETVKLVPMPLQWTPLPEEKKEER